MKEETFSKYGELTLLLEVSNRATQYDDYSRISKPAESETAVLFQYFLLLERNHRFFIERSAMAPILAIGGASATSRKFLLHAMRPEHSCEPSPRVTRG